MGDSEFELAVIIARYGEKNKGEYKWTYSTKLGKEKDEEDNNLKKSLDDLVKKNGGKEITYLDIVFFMREVNQIKYFIFLGEKKDSEKNTIVSFSNAVIHIIKNEKAKRTVIFLHNKKDFTIKKIKNQAPEVYIFGGLDRKIIGVREEQLTVSKILNDIIKEEPELKPEDFFFFDLWITELKFLIAHLLLPVDIDFQGIQECRSRYEEKTEEYIKKIFSRPGIKNGYFKKKLANLQFMIAKIKENSPDIQEKELPYGKCVLCSIPPNKKDFVKKEWMCLLKLCGIDLKQGQKDYFNQSLLEPESDSPIYQFMKYLDDNAENAYVNIDTIMDFFATLNDNQGWLIEGTQPRAIKSFHDWFEALLYCVDKIREKL